MAAYSFRPDSYYFTAPLTIIERLVPKGGDAEDVASIVHVIDLILERKRQYFPDFHKVIIEHRVTIDGDNINLDVGSAPVKPL